MVPRNGDRRAGWPIGFRDAPPPREATGFLARNVTAFYRPGRTFGRGGASSLRTFGRGGAGAGRRLRTFGRGRAGRLRAFGRGGAVASGGKESSVRTPRGSCRTGWSKA